MHVTHLFKSLKYSLRGLAAAWRDEIAFRQECLLAVLHFAALAVLPLSLGIRVLMAVLWVVLIAVELLNTAIETVTNLASPEYHVLAGKAKDCASAAVFVIVMLIICSWVILVTKLMLKY